MGGDSAGRKGFVLTVLLNLRFRYSPTGLRPTSVNFCMLAIRHFERADCDPLQSLSLSAPWTAWQRLRLANTA